jgi:hypothetical protein
MIPVRRKRSRKKRGKEKKKRAWEKKSSVPKLGDQAASAAPPLHCRFFGFFFSQKV